MKSGGLKKVIASTFITKSFVQMLEKKSVKLRHISSSFTACLQPAATDFVTELGQISLRNNFFHPGI